MEEAIRTTCIRFSKRMVGCHERRRYQEGVSQMYVDPSGSRGMHRKACMALTPDCIPLTPLLVFVCE